MATADRPSFDSLRQQGKDLASAAGITHCQALHLIAQNHGFSTWAGLRVAYGKQSRSQKQ